MNIPTESDQRAAALATLWLMLDLAANEDTAAAVERWLAARDEEDGGFLWLTGVLGMRPSAIEETLRPLILAPADARKKLRGRLVRNLKRMTV